MVLSCVVMAMALFLPPRRFGFSDTPASVYSRMESTAPGYRRQGLRGHFPRSNEPYTGLPINPTRKPYSPVLRENVVRDLRGAVVPAHSLRC